MLLLAQKEQGYVKAETIEYVGKYLDLDPSEVESIMSFYTLLRRHPVGKYHILICTNLACMLQGSDDIEACVKRKLGVRFGQGHARRTVSPPSNSNASDPARPRPSCRSTANSTKISMSRKPKASSTNCGSEHG